MAAYYLRPAEASEKDRIFESYRATVGPYVAETWGWDESFQTANFWKYHPLRDFQFIQVEHGFGGGLHIEEDESDLYIRMIFLLPRVSRHGHRHAIGHGHSQLGSGQGKESEFVGDSLQSGQETL
jgi:hypothetical protein